MVRGAFSRFIAIASISLLIGATLTTILLSSPRAGVAANAVPISGWAWSDSIGWISMSGSNYGLSMDSTTGTVTGYAWSDNVGWISANAGDIAPCASGAISQIASGIWTGWLRATAGGTAQSGGWDGCISMSGTGYGVTYDGVTGAFAGYAWEGNADPGAAVIGWVDFSLVSTTPQQCTASCSCAGLTLNCTLADCSTTSQQCSYDCQVNACIAPPSTSGSITATPQIVSLGQTSLIGWNVQNVKNDSGGHACTVTATNGDGTGTNTAGWSSNTNVSGNSSGSKTSSAISTQTTYTLTCNGLDGSTFTDSVTINVIPSFREI